MKLRLTVNQDTSPMGRRMTERMLELKLSDEDVADMTGLHKDTIRAYRRLSDPHPTAQNAALVAQALQWPTDRLLRGTVGDVPANANETSSKAPLGVAKATVGLANELRDQLRAVYAELNGLPVDRVDIRIELR
jgi:transcriptional regulator with XRE-family HTH domain